MGPKDLSVSLEIHGEVDHARTWEAVDHLVEAAEEHGLAAGMRTERLQHVIACGKREMRCLMHSSDTGFLAEAARTLAQALRQPAANS